MPPCRIHTVFGNERCGREAMDPYLLCGPCNERLLAEFAKQVTGRGISWSTRLAALATAFVVAAESDLLKYVGHIVELLVLVGYGGGGGGGTLGFVVPPPAIDRKKLREYGFVRLCEKVGLDPELA